MTRTDTRTLRAGAYERVSTKDQSAARQSTENRQAIESHGWQLARTYDQDSGKSASRYARNAGRPDHAAALADITSGALDILVTHEVSRTDRRTTRWSALLDACMAAGVLIHVTSKRRTYDPREWEDRETLLRAGIAAEGESEILSARILSGKAEGARQGRPQGSIAYGIQRRRDPLKTRHAWLADEPHPQTAPVVARIAGEVAAGRPYVAIAADLTAAGVACPGRATAWHGTTVASIAGNDVYVAAGIVAGETSAAIKARQARERAAYREGRQGRPGRQTHRYSGALQCAACGHPIVGYTDPAGRRRYRCKAIRGHGGGCVSIDGAALDTYVDAWAIARLSRPDLVDLVGQATDGAAAHSYRAQAAALQAELDEWAGAGISARAYAIRERETLPRIAALQRKAEQAETPAALAGLPGTDPAMVAARWHALETSARRRALAALAPLAMLSAGRRGHPCSPADRVNMTPEE